MDLTLEADGNRCNRGTSLRSDRLAGSREIDSLLQLLQIEGLLEQSQDAPAVGFLEQIARRKARDQDRVEARMQRSKHFGYVEPVDMVLEHPIRDQDVGRGIDPGLERLPSGCRRNDVVPLVRQIATQGLAERILVFHDHDSRHAPPSASHQPESRPPAVAPGPVDVHAFNHAFNARPSNAHAFEPTCIPLCHPAPVYPGADHLRGRDR
jgi:hypothetical protein